jgi:hypothetical protein
MTVYNDHEGASSDATATPISWECELALAYFAKLVDQRSNADVAELDTMSRHFPDSKPVRIVSAMNAAPFWGY